MANKTTNTTPTTTSASPGPPSLEEINALRQKHKVDRATFAGVCADQGWANGKVVAESEFLAAVDEFKQSPMGGKKKEKEEEK